MSSCSANIHAKNINKILSENEIKSVVVSAGCVKLQDSNMQLEFLVSKNYFMVTESSRGISL